MSFPINGLFVIDADQVFDQLLHSLQDANLKLTYLRVTCKEFLPEILDQVAWDIVLLAPSGEADTVVRMLKTFQESATIPWIVINTNGKQDCDALVEAGAAACLEMDELASLGGLVTCAVRSTRCQRKRSIEMATDEEEKGRLQEIFENAPIGIFRSSVEGRLLDVNARLAKILGYGSREELLRSVGNLATDVYFDEEKRSQVVSRLMKETDWIREEMKIKRKDGSLLTVDMTGRRVMDGHGKPLFFEGFIEDISERKRTEEALRVSENQFRAFFDKGSDGVVILDPQNGRIVNFNDQACRQLGYSREEFSQLNLTDLEINESPEEIRAHIQKVMQEGIDTFETKQRSKQGEIQNIKVTAQVIQTDSGPIYYCLFRDITEYKQTEMTLALSQARLLEAQSVSNTGSWDLDLISKEMWGSEESHHIYGL